MKGAFLSLLIGQSIYANNYKPCFKSVQYTEEKLDFLVHKELEDSLYDFKKGLKIAIPFGFDHQMQSPKKQKNGFEAKSFYQILGFSYLNEKNRNMAGLGCIESYLNLDPKTGSAKFPTLLGFIGSSFIGEKTAIGLDGLFSYGFIDAKQKDFKSDHGIYNASFDLKGLYKISRGKYVTFPYFNLGAFYSHENSYQEKGVFKIKNENLLALRGQIGVKLETKESSVLRAFSQVGWLVDYYCFSKYSIQTFIQNDTSFKSFLDCGHSTNFGLIEMGIKTETTHFFWKIGYRGLFGKNFSQNDLNLNLEYVF
jgi:hypothetical protein